MVISNNILLMSEAREHNKFYFTFNNGKSNESFYVFIPTQKFSLNDNNIKSGGEWKLNDGVDEHKIYVQALGTTEPVK